METKTFETQLKPFGIKLGFMSKNLYHNLAEKISDSEIIVDAVEGIAKGTANVAPAVLTNRFLYLTSYTGLIAGINFVVIPRERITSASTSSGLMMASITIKDGTVIYEIDKIIRPIAERFVRAMLETVSKEPSNTPTHSNADEIRKYKALYDDGILSEEEFLAKKKSLLGL